MKPAQGPEQITVRFATELCEKLRAAHRGTFRYSAHVGEVYFSLRVGPPRTPPDESPDLPPALRAAKESTRQTYRALVALRAEVGGDARVRPVELLAFLNEGRDDEASINTVNHALSDLKARRVAWSHPARGWVTGCEQPTLPFESRQSDSPSGTANAAYAGDGSGASARPFTSEGSSMITKQRVWVPGERFEETVVVVDAVTEEAVGVSERTGFMRVPTRTGRLTTVAAVRGDLVSAAGKLAEVRLPGGKCVRTRILGDWHLAGLTSPPIGEAGPTGVA